MIGKALSGQSAAFSRGVLDACSCNLEVMIAMTKLWSISQLHQAVMLRGTCVLMSHICSKQWPLHSNIFGYSALC